MTTEEAEAVAHRLDLAAEDGSRTLELVDARSLREIGISPHLTGRIVTASRELETHGPRLAAIIRTRMRELEPPAEPLEPAGAYAELSAEELAAEVEARGLVVVRADERTDLDPLMSDNIAALEADDIAFANEQALLEKEAAEEAARAAGTA